MLFEVEYEVNHEWYEWWVMRSFSGLSLVPKTNIPQKGLLIWPPDLVRLMLPEKSGPVIFFSKD